MNDFEATTFIAARAIGGIVVIIAALLSGLVERSGLPQVAVSLAPGAALGPAGLSVLDVSLDAPTLPIIATLSLVFRFFTGI